MEVQELHKKCYNGLYDNQELKNKQTNKEQRMHGPENSLQIKSCKGMLQVAGFYFSDIFSTTRNIILCIITI